MSVFMSVIGITGGVVYRVLKLKDSSSFLVCKFSTVEHFVVLVHGVCFFCVFLMIVPKYVKAIS